MPLQPFKATVPQDGKSWWLRLGKENLPDKFIFTLLLDMQPEHFLHRMQDLRLIVLRHPVHLCKPLGQPVQHRLTVGEYRRADAQFLIHVLKSHLDQTPPVSLKFHRPDGAGPPAC